MQDSERYREKARSLLAVGRLDEARSAAGRAVAADPSDARSHRLLGEIELAAGEIDTARDCAQRAVVGSADPASLHLLARVERRAGRYHDSVRACLDALAIEADLAPVYVTLSLATVGPWLAVSGQSDVSTDRDEAVLAAKAAAERALELDPEVTGGYYAAGVAHLAVDELVDASTVLEQGLALDPEWADGHVLMGTVRLRQGMVKLASRHFATAGRLDPRDTGHIRRLRSMKRRTRLGLRRKQSVPWHLAPEARHILARDAELSGFEP